MQTCGDQWRSLKVSREFRPVTKGRKHQDFDRILLTNFSRNSCCESEQFRLCMLQGPTRFGRLWGMCLCGGEEVKEEREK